MELSSGVSSAREKKTQEPKAQFKWIAKMRAPHLAGSPLRFPSHLGGSRKGSYRVELGISYLGSRPGGGRGVGMQPGRRETLRPGWVCARVHEPSLQTRWAR